MLKRIPHTYTIISSVILLCAVLSWIIPAGEYMRQTVEINGVPRTVIVDHSFHPVEQAPQTWQVFSALLDGFERQAGIIAFLLIMGGAFQIMNSSRAIDAGIFSFLGFTKGLERYRFIKMLGVNNVVISLIIILFSLFGAVFGMSEETLAFVIIIVPLAISMGYDSITGLCMVYVAAHVGFSGAVLNPFTIGIAQGLSDLPLFSGFEYRMFCWVVLTVLLIACVLRYASVIKRNPEKSPMYRADAYWRKRGEGMSEQIAYATTRSAYIVYVLVLMALVVFSVCYPQSTFVLGESSVSWYAVPFLTVLYAVFGWLGLRKSNHFFILVLLAFTILYLIVGVMGHGWYLPEISAIFLAMGILSGFANSEQTDTIIKQFLDGAKDMLSAAIVVGLAGGNITRRSYYRSYSSFARFVDGRGREICFVGGNVFHTDIDKSDYTFRFRQSGIDHAYHGAILRCNRPFAASYGDGLSVWRWLYEYDNTYFRRADGGIGNSPHTL